MARKTRATAQLEQAGKPFRLLEYVYDPEADSIGLQAAQALGVPAALVFKTLMVRLGEGVGVALVPSDRELDLKALAAAAGVKAAAMLKPAEAERLTGYHVGGISPFGQKKRLPTFLDRSALEVSEIIVNGGQRGLQIRLAPAILVAVLAATVAAIASRGESKIAMG
jgi:Cys-tRNA(Pro)/Cys-tRNA(Cys) deacylase